MHGIEEGLTEFITWCDYLGTFAFAISGIRLAAARRFDWFGAYVVGVVTAVAVRCATFCLMSRRFGCSGLPTFLSLCSLSSSRLYFGSM